MSEVTLPASLAANAKQSLDALVKLQYQMHPNPRELACAIASAAACSIFLGACIEQAEQLTERQ